MPFLSFLGLLPVLGFVYTICFIAREERAKMSDSAPPPATSLPNSPVRQGAFSGRRQIKWISGKEFKALSSRSEDLILIVIQRKTAIMPIPFPKSHILYIEPDRLIDLLQWLPSTSGAILYGAYGHLSSTVRAVRNLAGSAPIYMVCDTPLPRPTSHRGVKL